MATTIGALRVELSANIAKFERDMGKAAKSLARTQRSFERFGNRASAAGQALSIGLTAPLVGIGAAALRSSVAFESAFAGVIKTVDDATDGMGRLTPVGEALQQGFRDLSLQIPIAATELAGIGEVAGQLGIESENILGFTEVMAKLGVTTNLSAEEAATSLAQLANITSLPQTEFERLGSTVVALGNNLATNEAQIVDFGKRIASAGTIAGLTEPQILAIGGAMASVGVESEAGGTAVQKVLNAMTKSVAQGGEKLEIFARTAGLSAAEFQRAFREDAAGAFASFVAGLGQQGDAAFTTLDGLTLGNERVVRSFLSLAAKSTTLTDALALGTTAWEENTALAREADIRFETTASQLKLLANQVVEAGRALGDILKPILQTVVGIVREQVVPWLKTIVDRFKALSPEVQQSRILWLGLAAALGPALIAMGGVARVLTPMLPLLSGVWRGAGRVSNAILMLIPNLRTAGASAAAFGARLKRLHLTNMARGFKLLGISSRGAGVGLRLAAVAAGGLRLALRGIVRALGPLAVIWAAFEFAQWAAGALDLGGKLKRLVGITDDAADSARDADAAYEGLNDTLAQTTLATERQALAALERGYRDLVAQLERARESNKRAVPGLLKRVRAQEQAIAAAQDRVKAAQQEVEAEQAAARAATDYTEALQAAEQEAAGITDTTGKQIRAARTLGVSLEQISKKFGISTDALKIYLGELAEADTPVDDLGDGVGTLSDEVQTLVDRLRGTGAIQAAHNWAAALDQVRGLTTLTDAETRQLVTTLDTAIAKWRALGEAVPVDVFERYMEASDRVRLNPPEQVFTQMGFEIADLHPTAIRAAHQQRLEAFRQMLDDARLMVGNLPPIGIPLEPEITPRFRTTIERALTGFGQQIGQTFARALEGGGNFLGAAQSLGVQGGTRLGEALSGGLAKKMVTETSVFSKGIGQFFGKAMGQAIPFVGPLIGLGIGKIFGRFTKPSEAELAARQQVKDYEDTILAGLSASQLADAADAAQGHWAGNERGAQFLIGVRDAYVAAGRSASEAEQIVGRYWAATKHGGPEAVAAIEAQIDAVVQVGREQQQRLAELGALKEAGQAAFDPAQIEPYLETLLETSTITAQQADQLRGLADEAHVDHEAMAAAAEKYGVSLSALGPAFDQARISDAATVIVKDFELMTQEGADVNGVLRDMQDEVQALVTDALTAGVAIPEGMRPILTSLIAQGRLTDANGQKLTDLSGLTFAEPLAAKFDTLIEKLTALIDTIAGRGGVTEAIEGIPREVEVGVDLRYREHDRPEGFAGVDVDQQWLGAIADLSGVRALATGGLVTRPTVALLGERDPEAVLPLSQIGRMGTSVQVHVDARGALFTNEYTSQRELARIVSDVIVSDLEGTRRLGLH